MEVIIEKIVEKLHHLPKDKILEVLNFVEFLTWHQGNLDPHLTEDSVRFREDEEFEVIADELADELQTYIGSNTPVLSDYAVSRAGIYEEHP
ncbi:hypothetical protein [Nostoc sp. TCL26-01]|uniref:hypothetical protein n=1 Tax=Nostoc sp. TCL26-01 TaxID=2576904 RepID=UPI0015B9F006|nr:hypothetical protein [Nostoc sp. TCL26-01]QLE58477.1 hypothetical protein FD725_24995 [Nostoc sp. TCL26-01]